MSSSSFTPEMRTAETPATPQESPRPWDDTAPRWVVPLVAAALLIGLVGLGTGAYAVATHAGQDVRSPRASGPSRSTGATRSARNHRTKRTSRSRRDDRHHFDRNRHSPRLGGGPSGGHSPRG